MTDTRDVKSLSRLEIVVLARLSGPRSASEAAVIEDVLALFPARRDAAESGSETVSKMLAVLRDRGMAAEQPRGKKSPLWSLTAEGGRGLRAALELGHTPTWLEVRDAHLPALALGLSPGSKQAAKTLGKIDSIAAAVLRTKYGIREAPTLSAVCDVLVADVLGLSPGPVTLPRIRTHALATRAGREATGTPMGLATALAAEAVDAEDTNKRAMKRALGRRWAQEASELSTQPALPVQPLAAERLLTLVREAIPRIGAKGRYGREKVFVSEIWHRIEHDHRLAGLSLDRFKRWLLEANRDGWLVLARADLVVAMNAELVAESEIEDRGATFHFVLDHRDGAPEAERENHAR